MEGLVFISVCACLYLFYKKNTFTKCSIVLAEQGDAKEQNNLGADYGKGPYVACPNPDALHYNGSVNYAEARKWYLKAAEQGLADAQCNLGDLYKNGDGVRKDYVEAHKWYIKAAKQGFANAQCNLGDLYKYGHGVEQNDIVAYAWWDTAAAQGSDIAKLFRIPTYTAAAQGIEVESLFSIPKNNQINPEDLIKAQELSKEYFKLYVEPFQQKNSKDAK